MAVEGVRTLNEGGVAVPAVQGGPQEVHAGVQDVVRHGSGADAVQVER